MGSSPNKCTDDYYRNARPCRLEDDRWDDIRYYNYQPTTCVFYYAAPGQEWGDFYYSDDSKDMEMYNYLSSDQYKLDPADGDQRGEYKENDKRRKKTWHSKGANPYHLWCKYDRVKKRDVHRQRRLGYKKYTRDIMKRPADSDKYHSGWRLC